ncbi:hypothetical protein JCM11251_000541 [Rhodosporidiobolus azoricus]
MVKVADALRRYANASRLAQYVDQRDFHSVVVHLHHLQLSLQAAFISAQDHLDNDQSLQWGDGEQETLERVSADDVQQEGLMRFIAIEVGWRRLAFDTPFLADDADAAREALDVFFSSPFEPHDGSVTYVLEFLERLRKEYDAALGLLPRRDRRQSVAEVNKSSLDQTALVSMTKVWARDAERLTRRIASIVGKFVTQSASTVASSQSQHNSQDSLPTPDPSSDGHEAPATATRREDASSPARKGSKKRRRPVEEEQVEAPAPVRSAKAVDAAVIVNVRVEVEDEHVAMDVDEQQQAADQAQAAHAPQPSPSAIPSSPAISRASRRDSSVQTEVSPPPARLPLSATEPTSQAPPVTVPLAPPAAEPESSQPQPLPSSRSKSRNSDAILALIGQSAQNQQKRLMEERRRSETGTLSRKEQVREARPSGSVAAMPVSVETFSVPSSVPPAAPVRPPTPPSAAFTATRPISRPPPSSAVRPPRPESKTPQPVLEVISKSTERTPRKTRSKSPLPPVSQAANTSGAQHARLGPTPSAILMPPPPSSGKRPSPSPIEAAPVPAPAPTSSGQAAEKEDSQGSNSGGYNLSSSLVLDDGLAHPPPAQPVRPVPLESTSSSTSAASLSVSFLAPTSSAPSVPTLPATIGDQPTRAASSSSQDTSSSLSQDGSLPNSGSRENLLLVPDTPVASGEGREGAAVSTTTSAVVEQVINDSRASSTSGFVVSDSQGSSTGSGISGGNQLKSRSEAAPPSCSVAAAEPARWEQDQQPAAADSQESSGITYISLGEAAEREQDAVEEKKERERAAAVAGAAAAGAGAAVAVAREEDRDDLQPGQSQTSPPAGGLQSQEAVLPMSQAAEATPSEAEGLGGEGKAAGGEADEYAYGGFASESQIMPFSQAVDFDEDEEDEEGNVNEDEELDTLDDADQDSPQPFTQAPEEMGEGDEETSSLENAASGKRLGRIKPRRSKSFGEVESEAEEAEMDGEEGEVLHEETTIYSEFLHQDMLE